MVGDSYSITVAEGGFIVHVNKQSDRPPDDSAVVASYVPRVFIDLPALINYLHNELVRSN